MSAGPHLDDDRLSALIDGEADAGDVAHAAGCADCEARVAAWQEARRLVAAPPEPPSEAQRQSAIAAALAAADGPARLPVSLSERQARRAQRIRLAAAVAAVVLVVGVVVAVVRHAGTSSSSKGAASAARSAPAAPSPTSVAGAAPTTGFPTTGVTSAAGEPASGGVAGTAGLGASVQLGPVDGPAPLVAALQAAIGGAHTATGAPSSRVPAATADLSRCLAPAVARARVLSGTPPTLQAALTYRDTPADAYVFQVGHQYVAAVVSEAGCSPLAEVTF